MSISEASLGLPACNNPSGTSQPPNLTSPSAPELQLEETMIHAAAAVAWRFTADDDKRCLLLVDHKDTSTEELRRGVSIKLFQAHMARPLARVSLQLIDTHLHRVQAHPTQLPSEDLDSFIQGKGVRKHVAKVVREKLLQCEPVGPNPTRLRGGKFTHCAYSALQYITRLDVEIADTQHHFNTHIFNNLVVYVKKKFFNRAYLERVKNGCQDILQVRTCNMHMYTHIQAYIHTNMHTCMLIYMHKYI
jgi:hypothetical protein